MYNTVREKKRETEKATAANIFLKGFHLRRCIRE